MDTDTKAEVAAEVEALLEKKFERYNERYTAPNESTIKKWRRRAVAIVEMRKFQLSLFPPEVLEKMELDALDKDHVEDNDE